eukprot:1146078-Pelagomonas_calceolata.AAC.3
MGGALQDEGTAVQKSTSLQRAVAGSLSGCVARFIIGPLDVIKIRFQVQLEPIKSAQSAAARHAASKYTGLGQALVTILKEEGIQGKLSDGRKFCMIIAFTYQGPLSRDEHPRIPTFRLPLPLSFSLSLSLSLKLECMMRASDLKVYAAWAVEGHCARPLIDCALHRGAICGPAAREGHCSKAGSFRCADRVHAKKTTWKRKSSNITALQMCHNRLLLTLLPLESNPSFIGFFRGKPDV